MDNCVDVNLGERSYRIVLSDFFQVDPDVFGGSGTSVLVVTDSNVNSLYGDVFEEQLSSAGLKPYRLVIPAGEKSKDFKFLSMIYDKALEVGLDRWSSMAALGGGVVGDLTGFAAATYLRGIRFVQVPTTLLAMVDSSVGGKTGVNLKQGKNLVGSFYQPAGVLINLKALDTLSSQEYSCGLAEVIKYGVIYDSELFGMLECGVEKVLERDGDMLSRVVARCCRIKAEVVGKDERESGLRAILNFGHTLGHALENLSGYGEILHGQAVSIGMVYAGRLSVVERGFPDEECDRLSDLLLRFGLPVKLDGKCASVEWDDVRGAMFSDKKTRNAVIKFVLADRIGSVSCGCEVSDDVLERVFGDLR